MSNQSTYGGFPPPQPPFQGQPQQYAPPYGGQQFAPPPGGPPPGFGWGPQFQPGPGGFHQPPKKKSKAGWIAVPIVLVFAAMIGFWAIGVIAKQKGGYVTQPASTASTDSPGSHDTPTAKTTAPKPTKTTPPPREATPYELVSRSKFYRTGTQGSIGCKESGARATSLANAVRYYSAVKACADRGWPRQVRSGGSSFRVPKTIVMNSYVQSPCGGYAPSSYYCAANETIYMAGAEDVATYTRYRNYSSGLAYSRAKMAFTVAHEYGHHIQELTGILEAYNSLRYDAASESARLEINRRLELQASCFAGVFLSANKGSYHISGQLKTQLDFLTNNSGDEYDPTGQRIHGKKKNHGYWFHRGYNTRNLAACNTFTAASSLVA